MQTGSIGKQDNWARFMQLSNEARMRNQGLGNGITKTDSLKKPVMARSASSVATGGTGVVRTGTLYTAAKPHATGRILGGKFDAYA